MEMEASNTEQERQSKRRKTVSARAEKEEKALEDFLFGGDDLSKAVKQAKFGKEIRTAQKAKEQRKKKTELFTISLEGSDHEEHTDDDSDDSDSDSGKRKASRGENGCKERGSGQCWACCEMRYAFFAASASEPSPLQC